jgi:hypothetical protein
MRIFAVWVNLYPGDPTTWYIIDLGLVSATVKEEPETEVLAIKQPQEHADNLAPGVL